MSIKIGDKNKIKNSQIGYITNISDDSKNKESKFYKEHPFLSSIFVGIITSLIMLFSLWEKIIIWLEKLM